jgi:hypothetical protein
MKIAASFFFTAGAKIFLHNDMLYPHRPEVVLTQI